MTEARDAFTELLKVEIDGESPLTQAVMFRIRDNIFARLCSPDGTSSSGDNTAVNDRVRAPERIKCDPGVAVGSVLEHSGSGNIGFSSGAAVTKFQESDKQGAAGQSGDNSFTYSFGSKNIIVMAINSNYLSVYSQTNVIVASGLGGTRLQIADATSGQLREVQGPFMMTFNPTDKKLFGSGHRISDAGAGITDDIYEMDHTLSTSDTTLYDGRQSAGAGGPALVVKTVEGGGFVTGLTFTYKKLTGTNYYFNHLMTINGY